MDGPAYLGNSRSQLRGGVSVACGAPAVDSISEWEREQQKTSPYDSDEGLKYRKELQAAIVAVTRYVNPCQTATHRPSPHRFCAAWNSAASTRLAAAHANGACAPQMSV